MPIAYHITQVEKILKGSLDSISIPSLSPTVNIQTMEGKVCLRCKSKTLLGVVNTLFVFKSLFCLIFTGKLYCQ